MRLDLPADLLFATLSDTYLVKINGTNVPPVETDSRTENVNDIFRDLSDRELQRLAALGEISRILNSTYKLDQALEESLKRILITLGAERGAILSGNPPIPLLSLVKKKDRFIRSRFCCSETILGRVIRGEEVVFLDAAGTQKPQAPGSLLTAGVRSVLAVPMQTPGKVYGMIYIDNLAVAGLFQDKELRLLRILADILAACIERTEYARQLEETLVSWKAAQEEIVQRLAKAAEFRDQETSEHIRRVGLYAACIARALGWDQRRVELLKLASQMHDVGKIGIPDELLLTSARYTKEQFETMKQHTVMGSSILSGSSSELVRLAEKVARTHHERWDGSGYPEGLKGEEIPIEGRIVALADVFDALMSKRRYKDSMSLSEVLKILWEERGKHFDPHLVLIFFQHLAEISQIWEQHQDAA